MPDIDDVAAEADGETPPVGAIIARLFNLVDDLPRALSKSGWHLPEIEKRQRHIFDAIEVLRDAASLREAMERAVADLERKTHGYPHVQTAHRILTATLSASGGSLTPKETNDG